jgi:hypothetical protein
MLFSTGMPRIFGVTLELESKECNIIDLAARWG